ncbi:MAG: response regulator [Kofleriaceae bacterium]
MDIHAILIAPRGASGHLGGLVDRLCETGIAFTVVDELPSAADMAKGYEHPPCVLIDLRELGVGEVEDVRKATQTLRRVTGAMPHVQPIVVLVAANPALIVACMRAGAGDVIDLHLEGTASARAVLDRVYARQRGRATEHEMLESQRNMIEDLLKDLIRTERRSIDIEEQLAAYARNGERLHDRAASISDSRDPAILLVEHDRQIADWLADRLEATGIATYAYISGEQAVAEATTVAGQTGLDLALVAAQLPGIDGLETIRQLRERLPGLPAFLMSSVHDADLAAHAADLGVVGFVHKPLRDRDEVVNRLAQLAREALHKAREHQYLRRIKERHELVLARYRTLPRQP